MSHALEGGPPDRRDLEIQRLRDQLEGARQRESRIRAEERERFRLLTAASKRFADSMRSRMEESQRQQRRLDAQYAVSRVLEDSGDLAEAAPEIFRVVGERLGWDVGVLWTVEGDALRCGGIWHAAGRDPNGFERACRLSVFRRGAGLPGRVWRRQAACWVEDVLEDDGFLRKEAAREAGLRCALAFPIQEGGRLVGVFELLKGEVSPADEDLVRVAYLVGHQLGQFVERRRAEKERDRALAREREARQGIGGILESINDAFFTVDDDWRFTYVNRRAEELWGRRRGELLGKNIWEEFPSAVGSEAHGAILRAAQTGETVGYEAFSPMLNAWVSGRAYPSSQGISVYFQDVTEIMEARTIIEDRERRYRTLATNIPGAVFRCVHHDGTPTMEFVSGRIEEITGYPAEDFVADRKRSYAAVIHPEDREKNARVVWRALERRGTYNIEYRIVHRDGGIRWANERGSGIFSENDELLWIDGAIFDITARKRAEEALRKSAGRAAFRAKLAESLRPLADPALIRSEAARVLGEHLRVDRVLYAEIDEAQETVTIKDNYVAEGVPKIVGRFPVSNFTLSGGRLRSGNPVVLEDVAADAELEEGERAALGALGIGSFAVVPLVKGGRWVSNLGVYHGAARAWSEAEVALVGETAERTWAAVERAHAEAALRESERRYRGLMDASSQVLYRHNPDWSEMRQLTGGGFLADTERPDPDWFDAYIHPDDQPHVRAAIEEAIRTKSVFELEHRVVQADGTLGWVLSRSIPVFDEDGEVVEWFGAASDVTARREAEERLRENGEWLRLAQRAARSGTWEWDLLTDEIRWSEEHRDLFGIDPSEKPIEREDWWAAVHPEDLPRIEEAGRRCLEKDEEWPEIEYRIFREGEVRWIAARGQTERDGEGRAVRILGISVDATERKEAEEERDRLLAREWVASAEAAERERISRELHDRVAHSMGVAHQSLQLYGILAQKDADRAEAKLDLAREMIKASLESTRNLSAELRRLDAEDNLEAELGRLLDVSVPPGIKATMRVSGDEEVVPGHVRGQLFLVLREAVRNAVSHSGCATISVELDVAPERVVGAVEDDGQGFDTNDGGGGVGLRSMRERSAMLDGVLKLGGGPGRGTRVEVSVPLTGER